MTLSAFIRAFDKLHLNRSSVFDIATFSKFVDIKFEYCSLASFFTHGIYLEQFSYAKPSELANSLPPEHRASIGCKAVCIVTSTIVSNIEITFLALPKCHPRSSVPDFD